jgi:hypothetical protein
MKYEKMLIEINEDISNEIKDIDYKIKFINDNSDFKIKYEEDSNVKNYLTNFYLTKHYSIEIGDEKEVFGEFNLNFIISCILDNIMKNIFMLHYDKEMNNYIKFKKKLDEIYDKVKLNVDLCNKLKHKENKKNKEKNIKI